MSDPYAERIEKRKSEIAKSKKQRKIIIGLYSLNSYTKSFLSEGQIYVQRSSQEGKIRADAYSPLLFESPNEPYTNRLNSHYVFEDSNIREGKETMPYDEFIERLARLNNVKEIKDDTFQHGISAVEKLIKKDF